MAPGDGKSKRVRRKRDSESQLLCEIPVLELARNANFFKPLGFAGPSASELLRFHAYRWCFSMSVQEAKQYSEPEDPASYGVGSRMAYTMLIAAITFTPHGLRPFTTHILIILYKRHFSPPGASLPGFAPALH